MNRITPENIRSLYDNQIFVFGSNEAGRHGKGAAKKAMEWGAIYGQSEGLQGSTYAIPTKDKEIKRTLNLLEISYYIERFIRFAKEGPHLHFLVTKIGCGLASHQVEDIGPLFENAIEVKNISLPKEFWKTLGKL